MQKTASIKACIEVGSWISRNFWIPGYRITGFIFLVGWEGSLPPLPCLIFLFSILRFFYFPRYHFSPGCRFLSSFNFNRAMILHYILLLLLPTCHYKLTDKARCPHELDRTDHCQAWAPRSVPPSPPLSKSSWNECVMDDFHV